MSYQPLTPLQFMALAASRIEPDRISKKPGTDLSYVEAYDIRAHLISIFGYGGFSYRVLQSEIIQVERDVPNTKGGTTNFRVTAMVRGELYIPQLEATYGGVAAANQSGAQIGEVADFAMKTADSDAFKRCAMNLGTQFGLSLYNDGSMNDVVKTIYAPGYEFQLTEKRVTAAAKFAEGGFMYKEVAPEAQALLERALKMKAEKDPDDEGVPMYRDPDLDPVS